MLKLKLDDPAGHLIMQNSRRS